MIDTSVNLKTKRPFERCSECDNETRYYNIWVSPTNDQRVICWECSSNKEKGFVTRYGINRGSNMGNGEK